MAFFRWLAAGWACLMLTSCTTAVPLLRDADYVVSSAMLAHGYPPAPWLEAMAGIEPDIRTVVAGHQVGAVCQHFGDPRDLLVAECFKVHPDGRTEYILPTCPGFATWYCRVAERHAMGHHYQYLHGLPLDHRGWGRFGPPARDPAEPSLNGSAKGRS